MWILEGNGCESRGSRSICGRFVIVATLVGNYPYTPRIAQSLDTMNTTARTAIISRKTNETDIQVIIDLDNQPSSSGIKISTGIGFLDHVRLPPAKEHPCLSASEIIL
jgi:hypothetical protein